MGCGLQLSNKVVSLSEEEDKLWGGSSSSLCPAGDPCGRKGQHCEGELRSWHCSPGARARQVLMGSGRSSLPSPWLRREGTVSEDASLYRALGQKLLKVPEHSNQGFGSPHPSRHPGPSRKPLELKGRWQRHRAVPERAASLRQGLREAGPQGLWASDCTVPASVLRV